jgi:hypothetical protein
MKWVIDKDYSEKEIGIFLEVVKEIIDLIIEKKSVVSD